MKRRGCALLLCLALLATLALLAACGNRGSEEPERSSGGGDRFDGTYYRYDGGEVCRQDAFFRMDGDVWTDEEGHTGKCRFSGDSVTLLYELHWADSLGAQVLARGVGVEGDTVHLYTGSIQNGRMELSCIIGGSLVYYLEGKITGEITEVSDGGERSEESYGGESVEESV